MSKDELIQNLGKIGFSGTSEFAKVLEDKDKAKSLIGQFGVGFYSVFMAADKIKVYSKSYTETGGRGWVWESDGYVVQVFHLRRLISPIEAALTRLLKLNLCSVEQRLLLI